MTDWTIPADTAPLWSGWHDRHDARTEAEAREKAIAIIEAKDGPRETWGEPQWGKR